jgi:nucleotide-binding universal stress UspA family protein
MAALGAMRTDARPIRTILVATDGSPPARAAVETAVDLAAAEGAELVAAYVVPRGDRRHPGHGLQLVAPRYLEVSAHDLPLHEAAELARRRGVPCELIAMSGKPIDALLDVERTIRPDLIVVGSDRARNPISRARPHLWRAVTRRAHSKVIVVSVRGG